MTPAPGDEAAIVGGPGERNGLLKKPRLTNVPLFVCCGKSFVPFLYGTHYRKIFNLTTVPDFVSVVTPAPGDEAAIVGDLGEETALLGASFMDGNVPASARKKFFSSPRNLQAYSFKPGEIILLL